MRTFRELKKVFIGEIIAVMMLLPFAAVVNGDMGISFIDFIDRYVLSDHNWFTMIQFGAFTILGTYVVYTLYKAIERDIIEIRDHFKKNKETTT